MHTKIIGITTLATILGVAIAPIAFAAGYTHCTVGVGGYDVVSYQNGGAPERGNGNFTAEHDGITYLFGNEANLKAFNADPNRYVPAYGGYCAYGVSVGKKFVGDPEVWRIVDGTLYLNLDSKIQSLWLEDVSGNIARAEKQWPKIAAKAPAEL